MNLSMIDKQNMAKAIYDFPDHLLDALQISKTFKLKNRIPEIKNIVVAGMGGSAIGGDVCRTLLSKKLKIPMVVSRNYSVPHWVNENTLVVCSSYSGNTEETLSAFADAQRKGAMICGISTGGKLTQILEKKDYNLIRIPSGIQPRAALAYSFVPMLYFLHAYGLIHSAIFDKVTQTAKTLKQYRDLYFTQKSVNPTFVLAKKVFKTVPIIYGTTETTAIAALRLKGQFCENADMLAYQNELPEMDHNELVGWENNEQIFRHFCVLWLTDANDHDRIKLRQNITEKIIGKMNKQQFRIAVAGQSTFERFVHLIHFGDWLSYWCAILHGTDPSPVKSIEVLKNELSKK